jgi:hypothetical protein
LHGAAWKPSHFNKQQGHSDQDLGHHHWDSAQDTHYQQ